MKFLLQVRFNGADTMIGKLPAGEQHKVTAEFEAIVLMAEHMVSRIPSGSLH